PGGQAETIFVVNADVLHYQDHVRTTLPNLRQVYALGLETGDFEFSSLASFIYSYHAYALGQNLEQLAQDIASYNALWQQLKQQNVLNLTRSLEQGIANLLGNSEHPPILSGDIYDYSAMVAAHKQSNDATALFHAHFNQMMLAYLLGEFKQATAQAELAQQNLHGVTGNLVVPWFYFYDALCHLAVCSSDAAPTLERVKTNQDKLNTWATHAPENYQHKCRLIQAECCRVLSNQADAIELYDQAIAGARANNYLQEEALAHELAAKFYLGWGKDKVAAGYMQEAYYCYSRWGAKAKITDLENRHPELLQPILRSPVTEDVLTTLTTVSAPTTAIHTETHISTLDNRLNQTFDFASILKASQALASTIHLDELLCQLTQIILQNSGGDNCALILPNETGLWQVRAVATPENTQLYTSPSSNHPNFPIKLVQYVKNTQTVVVINDLKTDLPVLDGCLRKHQPKSLLCLPLLNQGHLIGILYLTNRLTSGVFTRDRITVLNFLCTQIAISLANARLYQLERQRADQLAASEKRLQTLFDQSADAVFLLAGQRIIDCNQAAISLLRYPSKVELLELQLNNFSPEKQPDGQLSTVKLKFMLLEAAQRCSFQFEWVCQRYGGEEFWGHIILTPIKDREKIIFHCIVRDISDRKKLEQGQSRLMAVLEAAPDFIGVANAKGEILWHNTRYRVVASEIG
ncbi:MAG: GAF domain-containing protein, partial [Cyanobacteria bacterium J06642_11]